jgi:serine-type D-Ala-D-Ala carboxypeptidase/endopeptidase
MDQERFRRESWRLRPHAVAATEVGGPNSEGDADAKVDTMRKMVGEGGNSMTTIVMPTSDQLDGLVASYLSAQPEGLAFAIGYASPQYSSPYGFLYFGGNASNQFGQTLTLGANTPFQLASVSKTFTATLYALLIRSANPSLTVGDYMVPNGPLQISSKLAGIPLDGLVNYTSGLPQDNETDEYDSPPYLPSPYSVTGMLSYLNASPPAVSGTGTTFTYSNLGFALMAAILSGTNPPGINGFSRLVKQCLLDPLSMGSMYFNQLPIELLPQCYAYANATSYSATTPGWVLFPAYFGAGGLVASASDMLSWLMFNMGIIQVQSLTSLLPVLQTPSTSVETPDNNQLGLGWFINPTSTDWIGTVWKDGGLDGWNTYIAFLPSGQPGSTPSQAGVCVLVNAGGITGKQTYQGVEVSAVIANDLLAIMQGQTPPADKSRYPHSIFRSPRGRAPPRG